MNLQTAARPEHEAHEGHEHDGEVAIARLLRAGVRIAAALLALALAASWLLGLPIGDHTLRIADLLAGRFGWVSLVAQLGLTALAITPLARVALAAGLFARAGERRQALFSFGVLALLLLALLLGSVES